ncbi:MAG: Rieske 2Fe-2S domain-containing protein [Ignavibacterium album]|jgi:nitrite reductase/ring-hydroxylating ferredoxin subunit|uniref:Rieske (2Fe-2S) protein n=1 Tax=Ignavibacterium album TaxID=591197 RepID=UPI0026F1029D|nr:Rieske 2Fe-2S domain-containing protein [Ignavibacterium album]MCX8107111.1 Rieske 2Fe-2S domain-containing protein [Ignavibacterium album]
MSEKKFYKVCKINELRENKGRRFVIPASDDSGDEVEIAVFKVDGDIYALSNICPHQHTALIYDGFIEDGCVVCPAHGWKFDLKTGNQPTGRKGLDVYPIKIEKDEIFVAAHSKKFNW